MTKRVFLFFIFILNGLVVFSQDNTKGTWFVYFGNQKINDRWYIQSDFQYRLKQVNEQESQSLLRAGLGYNLTPTNHNILLGAAYINTQFDNKIVSKSAIQEQRVYQQYLYKNKFNDYFITHRVRLEERFFPSEFGLRSRYFLAMQKSLNGKSFNRKSIYGSLFNEYFFDIKNSSFDRNRFYAGFGYAINKDIRIETGYMIQVQKNISRGQVQLVVYNNLAL
jgi:hypothetical protein